MSKALVIKGANFFTNRIEQIVISDPIPCTGISLSQNTLTFTAIGATATLTATLTPSNTTETLTWVSSDEDVATVNNGVVTCVGIGTATITATCGEQVATCAITTSVTINLSDYQFVNGYAYSSSLSLPEKNYIGLMSSTRGRVYYSSQEYGTYRAFVGAQQGKYAIPLPNGATSVTINPPEGFRSAAAFALVDVNSKQTYVTGEDGDAALGIFAQVKASGTFPWTVDISAYTEANGFIVDVRTPSGGDPSTVTGDTLVTFS